MINPDERTTDDALILRRQFAEALENLRRKEGKMVKTKRKQVKPEPIQSPRRAPDESAYRAILEHTLRVVDAIPDRQEALALIQRSYPRLHDELTNQWPERLSAGVGVVRLERFREICDEFAERWIELVNLATSAKATRFLTHAEKKKGRS